MGICNKNRFRDSTSWIVPWKPPQYVTDVAVYDDYGNPVPFELVGNTVELNHAVSRGTNITVQYQSGRAWNVPPVKD